jgi:P4 family phage/plasmid primase-like protien
VANEPHAGATFLANMFGSSTADPVFVCSLPNEKGSGPGERFVTTRNPDDIAGFARKWDRAGRGLFFCVSTLKPNARCRSKKTVSELNCLFADIDFKDTEATPEQVRKVIDNLMCPPAVANASGHGLHLFWPLKEALPATPENVAEVERLLASLAHHLGGDPAVAEVSRLLRLPGTHNTKNDERIEVVTEVERPLRYELDDLREWLELVSERPPLIARRAAEGNGRDANPWLELARRQGYKPPVDVEQRLAAMQFQGVGDAAIHPTQLAVSASMLTHGSSIDDVVEMLLAATRAAAGDAGRTWNWQREEHGLRKMCETWLAKHPEVRPSEAEPADAAQADTQPEEPQPEEPQPEEPQPQAAPALAGGTAKKRRRKRGRATLALLIADGAIAEVRHDGQDLLLTAGELHVYQEGIWAVANAAFELRLRVLLQKGAEVLGEGGDVKLLSAAWRRLQEHPDLYREHIAWDVTGKVALANGVLDLRTREFGPWSPEHFLRRKLGVSYDPAAKAPQFTAFLARLFEDLDRETGAAMVTLLQEFAGATLGVPLLHREQRRALFLVGPSRSGKTELARLLSRLIGTPVASPSVGEISERFGLACFFDAAAWVRDDAVNEGDRLDPQRFKTIVTGEPIDIERKYRPAVRVALAIPVVLTANSLPASRDASDAVFNRSLVVDLTRVFDEQAAIGVRRHLRVPPGTTWLADVLFAREGPGILNWALAGLARLLERGAYDIPECVGGAIQRFKDENNPVAEFARTMLERSADTKVNRADLICAFHGWLKEEVGDDAKPHGARWLMPKLRTTCPWAIARTIGPARYLCGAKLTEEALKHWYAQASAASQSGRGSKGASAMAKDVNQAWSPLTEGEDSHDE